MTQCVNPKFNGKSKHDHLSYIFVVVVIDSIESRMYFKRNHSCWMLGKKPLNFVYIFSSLYTLLLGLNESCLVSNEFHFLGTHLL